MYLVLGVYLVPGGVSAPGVCVSALGGVCVCSQGSVCSGEMSVPRGVFAPGGCLLPGGWYPSMH